MKRGDFLIINKKALEEKYGQLLKTVILGLSDVAIIEVNAPSEQKELIIIASEGESIPIKKFNPSEMTCENLVDARILYPKNKLCLYIARGEYTTICIDECGKSITDYIVFTKDRQSAIFMDESEIVELANLQIQEKFS